MRNTVNDSSDFKVLKSLILGLSYDQECVDQQRVDNIASIYFKRKFPKCTINLDIKYEGVQLGTLLTIDSYNQKPITYYVKTHSDGLAYEKSKAAKKVNPIELMVYKIL